MILIEKLFIVRDYLSEVIWKDSLFTIDEAELEKLVAEKETGKKYEVIPLDEYFEELRRTYY